jgi:glycosyltransferase involved in cell wall biosynthesis
MRFHVLGIPHTITHPDWCGCAFTQKVAKFLKMMSGRGHELIHYGHADSLLYEHPDISQVSITDNKLFRRVYGNYDWKTNGFAHYYRADDEVHQTFWRRAISQIGKRKKPDDFLLCFWGWGHKPIADAHPDLIAVEPGIGYGGAWARWRVYESHTIRNAFYGLDGINNCTQDWYDVVIPNYFDPDDFEYSDEKQDYILYLGRVYAGKGVDIAIQATAVAGKRLVVAGQGTLAQMGYTRDPDQAQQPGYAYLPAHVQEVGYADPAKRRQLLRDAQALIIGSKYLEPFGGVQVEAWLSGTPVISPDTGAFAELNEDGVTGYRCRTFADYVQACRLVDIFWREECRSKGEQFTLDAVAPQYERYFHDVLNTYVGEGWYQLEETV